MTLNARRAVLALLLDLMMGIIQLEKNVTSAGHGSSGGQRKFLFDSYIVTSWEISGQQR